MTDLTGHASRADDESAGSGGLRELRQDLPPGDANEAACVSQEANHIPVLDAAAGRGRTCARLCCRARCRNPRGRGPQVRAHHELLPLPTVPVARADLGTFHIQIAPVESSQIHGVSQVDPFIPGGLVKYDLQGIQQRGHCRVTRRCPQAAQAALAAGCVLGCAGGHRRRVRRAGTSRCRRRRRKRWQSWQLATQGLPRREQGLLHSLLPVPFSTLRPVAPAPEEPSMGGLAVGSELCVGEEGQHLIFGDLARYRSAA
mmetsp:Transcript_4065/g.9554  ORF Transcript_4065/g.9554 Transcript_4065/m.9554 type:complete len:258 (-) Transcript_4065:583-1356(-)